MTSKPDYSEIVKQAEAAVASIKDSDSKGDCVLENPR